MAIKTGLKNDVQQLTNLTIRIADKIDKKRYRNALLSLRSAITVLQGVATITDLDEHLDIKFGKVTKTTESTKEYGNLDKEIAPVEEPKKKLGIFS